LKKVIDQKARQQALDCQHSFIIQAPAGSGKTELLTQRFLALLSKVEQPEEILAITFTRKAASEMRERIIKSLKLARSQEQQPQNEPDATTWYLGRQVLKHNEKNQWNLLENPQRLQVQTIDGFCASLTRRLPYLSGLGSEANTTERSASIYQEAARQTLALINSNEESWTKPIETLLLHLDGNQGRAEKLLADMLAKREQWLRHLIHDEDNLIEFRYFLEQSLEALITDELIDKSKLLTTQEITDLQILSQYALENINNSDAKADYFDDYNGELAAQLNIETYSQWQAISLWLLTTSGTLRKTMDKNRGFPAQGAGQDKEQKEYFKTMKLRMVALLERLADKQSLFLELKQLPPIQYDDNQWQLLESLMHCLKLATGLLKVIFSQKGEMDFQEVSLRATQALGDEEQPTDLTLALDYQLKHILIDEFQDTSHGQFNLLQKLLRGWQVDDGRSLFLVGDPMQSIYRFREADVGLFLRVREQGIANIFPRSLQLKVNFRSTANIVNWVNQTFTKILPEQENISHGAVSYSESIAFDESDSGGVKVYAFFNDEGLAEASKLASLVKEHCENNRGSSLAVLVKSRSQLITLIPAFQTAGLKFKATEIELLGHRPVITDLQMLTRAITDPTDRVAWLALLRGPWCGLLLEDLLQIAGSKTSSIMLNCLSDTVHEKLSDDGIKRLTSIIDKVMPWININSRGSIRKNIEGCWLSLDGPAFIVNEIDLQAAELYLDLVSTLEQGGIIKDTQELLRQLSELYAPVAADANPDLQLMTIHKSKGLEFDTVILPTLNAGSRQDDHTLLRWMEVSFKNNEGLLMAPIHAHINKPDPVYDYLSSITKKQRHYEAGRQLYVACTRAKRKLILTATLKTKQDSDIDNLKAKSGSQLAELWPTVAADFKAAFVTTPVNENTAETDDAITQVNDYQLRRIDKLQGYASEKLFNHKTDFEIPSSPSWEQPLLFAASAMKRHVGTLTHSWLEQIADNAEQWPVERINLQKHLIKNQLRQLGVASSELSKAVELVSHNLQQTLLDPQGIYLLSRHNQSVSELALERIEEGEFKSYIIDRTFIDDQGTRWIIDYKTSTHEGAGRDDFLKQQKQHYLTQLENYASLLAELETIPIKLVLYFTSYQKLISWDWQKE